MKRLSCKKITAFLLSFVIFSLNINIASAATNFSVSSTQKANNYPIIMVHGVFGWGGNELFGVNYWGGTDSIRQEMINKGYDVYTPTIGSFSSNWDRACELYAYLLGGKVDYGVAHALKYGHERYGRTYPGIGYRISDVNKIHLLGHSMGGQTSRVLVQLLEQGSVEEKTVSSSENISPLFTGNKHWVSSVTTLCTPHDGSSAKRCPAFTEPLFHQFIGGLAMLGGTVNSDNPIFDYKLDQWGLKKQRNESGDDYNKRVLNSIFWKNTKDLSPWDLSPEGARELNSWVTAQSDVYYFSIAATDTYESGLTKYQVPKNNMNLLLMPFAAFIGCTTNNKPGDVVVDKTWWRNDGLVSVVSAIGPHTGSKDKVINYNGNPVKGVWNYIGVIDNVDHLGVVGLSENGTNPLPKFFDIAKIVTSIPK